MPIITAAAKQLRKLVNLTSAENPISTLAYGFGHPITSTLVSYINATGQLTPAINQGLGGTVTQATSRTTGVTLNKGAGAITLFAAAGSATLATFTVTNSAVAANDVVVISSKSGTNVYIALVTAVAAGSFNVSFYTTGGTASDSPVFNFVVVKGVIS